MMTRGRRILPACAIALLVIGTGGFAALMLIPSVSQTTSSMAGALGSPFTLTATDGRIVTDQTHRGKWVLIYFGYTSCPDACPTALNGLRARPGRSRSRYVAARLHRRGPETRINPEGKFVRVIAGDVSGEELAERLRHWMNKSV